MSRMDVEAGQIAFTDNESRILLGAQKSSPLLPSHADNEKESSYSPTPNRSPSVQSWENYAAPPREPENDYLADSERVEWTDLKDKLREQDQRKIKNCNDDINTLLVFAGLFSAIITAFSIVSYQTLTLQPGDAAVALLTQVSQQIHSISENGVGNVSLAPFPPPPEFSGPSVPSVWINTLWFSSLVCSLVSASLGMLVKQWLREYLAGVYISPQQQLRSRHYHYEGLLKGRVFEIAAFLPVLLQLALVLFFTGLSIFLQGLNFVVGYVITGLVAIWLLTYLITIVAPILWSQCPYKTPLLDSTVLYVRYLLARTAGTGSRVFKKPSAWLNNAFPGDLKGVRHNIALDAPALIAADATFLDDTFLDSVIRPCVQDLGGEDAVLCMRQFLAHRIDGPVCSLEQPLDFKAITTQCLRTLVQVLAATVAQELDNPDTTWHPWMHEACVGMWAALQHAYYESRYLSSAKDQALGLPLKSLFGNVEISEGLLISLLPFRDIKFSVPSLTHEATSVIIDAARRVLAAHQADPLRLCNVILRISLFQGTFQDELVVLYSDIASAIREWTRSHAQDSDADAQICLDGCTLLNDTFPGSIGTDLTSILSTLAAKDRLSRRDSVRDVTALLRPDAEIVDDVFLGTVVRPSLTHVSGQEVIRCMRKVVAIYVRQHVSYLSGNVNLYKIGANALGAMVHILVDALDKAINDPDVEWSPWMEEALMFVTAIQHHSHFGGRPIGQAMPRCQVFVSKLFTRKLDIVREGILALSLNLGISGSLPPSSKAMLIIIEAARQLLQAGRVGPFEICHILLHEMSSISGESLRDNRRECVGILRKLAPEIDHLRREGGLKYLGGHSPFYVARECLSNCRKLDKKYVDFVDPELMEVLNKIEKGEYTT